MKHATQDFFADEHTTTYTLTTDDYTALATLIDRIWDNKQNAKGEFFTFLARHAKVQIGDTKM